MAEGGLLASGTSVPHVRIHVCIKMSWKVFIFQANTEQITHLNVIEIQEARAGRQVGSHNIHNDETLGLVFQY